MLRWPTLPPRELLKPAPARAHAADEVTSLGDTSPHLMNYTSVLLLASIHIVAELSTSNVAAQQGCSSNLCTVASSQQEDMSTAAGRLFTLRSTSG
jgi:hypothetical protein